MRNHGEDSPFVVLHCWFAGANEIAASAVGLVYLFAIGPTIIVKLTAPYWFHLVGYSIRFWVAAVLMACSFITVGLSKSTAKQVGLLAASTTPRLYSAPNSILSVQGLSASWLRESGALAVRYCQHARVGCITHMLTINLCKLRMSL